MDFWNDPGTQAAVFSCADGLLMKADIHLGSSSLAMGRRATTV